MSASVALLAVLFGLVVGSFLNVVICRLPLGQSVVTPRSYCPHCGHFIRWYDNIPIASFVCLGGQCRFCKKGISWQYPLVELVTALLSFLVSMKFGNLLSYFLYFPFLVCPLIALSFIDLKHRTIPDLLSLPGIGAGLLVALVHRGIHWEVFFQSLAGIAAGGGSLLLVGWAYEKIRKQEGLGMGDVKLAAMLGAFFGWKGIFLILMLSSLLGSLAGLALILFLKKGLRFAIPYGPFLSAGGLLTLFFGNEWLTLYLRLVALH